MLIVYNIYIGTFGIIRPDIRTSGTKSLQKNQYNEKSFLVSKVLKLKTR